MPLAELVGRVVLGHVDVGGQRRAAERPQVDVDDHVALDARGCRDPRGGLELELVALPVAEAQRVNGVPLALGDRQHRGRVEPAAEQHHRWFSGKTHRP